MYVFVLFLSDSLPILRFHLGFGLNIFLGNFTEIRNYLLYYDEWCNVSSKLLKLVCFPPYFGYSNTYILFLTHLTAEPESTIKATLSQIMQKLLARVRNLNCYLLFTSILIETTI